MGLPTYLVESLPHSCPHVFVSGLGMSWARSLRNGELSGRRKWQRKGKKWENKWKWRKTEDNRFFKQICCYCNLFYPASEMNGMKADSLSSPTGSQNFSFSRTSSTGSIPAVGCTSSASSAQNSGKFPVLHLRTMFVFLCWRNRKNFKHSLLLLEMSWHSRHTYAGFVGPF